MTRGAEKKYLASGKKYFQYLIYNDDNASQMHSALKDFYQISHIHSTDFSAVANIDFFPGKQSIFWHFKSLEKCKHPLGAVFSALWTYILHTHTHTHVVTAQNPSLFAFPAKDDQKSLCHLWMAGAGS